MSATIKDIAKAAGVTKMAIIGRMKKIPGFYDKYTRKDINKHNMVIINDEGVKKLESLSFNSSYGNKSRHKARNTSQTANSKSTSILLLKSKLDDYKRMLNDKQGDLSSAREQIKQLNHQVENAQKLELLNKQESQQKSQSYEAKISGLNKQLKELPSYSSNATKVPKKRGFWSRIFGD